MKILVTGATGLVGSALAAALEQRGDLVLRVTRAPSSRLPGTVAWDPASGSLDAAALEGIDAAVHLAGENIAAGRWNAARKRRIRDSRVRSTRLLVQALGRLAHPPHCLISASAVGYYGNRGAEVLREDSPPGTGFLPEVCWAWEREAQAAAAAGIRPVLLRIGVVLSERGGMLARLLPMFRLGLGGRIGSGDQYMSWVTLEDLVEIVLHALGDASLSGPVNAVTPHPVRNEEFTQTLGRILRRPTFFAIPAPLARLALGEMADALLLASARAEPAVLQRTSFSFRWPRLEPALRRILGP